MVISDSIIRMYYGPVASEGVQSAIALKFSSHFSDASIILDNMGSTGSSAIRLPVCIHNNEIT